MLFKLQKYTFFQRFCFLKYKIYMFLTIFFKKNISKQEKSNILQIYFYKNSFQNTKIYSFFKDFCKIKNFKLQNTNKNTKIFFKNTFENKKIKDFSKIFTKICNQNKRINGIKAPSASVFD